MVAADPYSRLVLFLRIALPLLALGILSTLFLFASKMEPGDAIPFAQSEVENRVRERRITSPIFLGVTSDGDKVTYTAEQIITGANGENEAINLTGLLELTEGGSIDLVSNIGTFDEGQDLATLRGDVFIHSTDGYTLRSQLMTSTLSYINVISPGRVNGTAPSGTLVAERMQITADDDGKNVQMHFSGGVKMVYDQEEKN